MVSDVHLGSHFCQGEALEAYLATRAPRRLVLGGDIIDLRQTHLNHWPPSHGAFLKRVIGWAQAGIPVHYLVGNHDAQLRSLAPLLCGAFQLEHELTLELDGVRTLFTHGDGLEWSLSMPHWVRFLGCQVYQATRRCERLWSRLGLRLPLVEGIKRLPRAARHIGEYEAACAASAAARGFGAVVVGHIHKPRLRAITVDGKAVLYANSGDWVDSRSALEFTSGSGWRLLRLSRDGGEEAAISAPAPVGDAEAPHPAAVHQ